MEAPGGSGSGGSLRSLEVLERAVQSERGAQLRHFDALDAKAGVMLGFAGALAALAPIGLNPIVEVGRGAAPAGALLSMWAFWPRRYGTIDLRAFRDRYLAAEPRLARLRLTDTYIAMADEFAITLHRKAGRLRGSMGLLTIGVLLVSVGVFVD